MITRVPKVQRRKEPEVGYGQAAARDHQFKPGAGGNPKGRPKGLPKELIDTGSLKEGAPPQDCRFGGSPRKRAENLFGPLGHPPRKVAEDAQRATLRAPGFLFNLYAALVSGELQPQDLSDDDREVLEAFANEIPKVLSKRGLEHERQRSGLPHRGAAKRFSNLRCVLSR